MTIESLSRKVRISPEVLVQEVGGESVLLDLASERYFGLDAVGTRVWQMMRDLGDLQDVHRAMLEEYQVEDRCLGADLNALVAKLADAGLISVEPSTTDVGRDRDDAKRMDR
jgi:ornithine carbamoyltransferase